MGDEVPMQVINPADLRGILSTPQTDIPLFYGDPSKDTVTPKFLMNRMLTAIATHNWTEAQAAGNFTLQLRVQLWTGLNTSGILKE